MKTTLTQFYAIKRPGFAPWLCNAEYYTSPTAPPHGPWGEAKGRIEIPLHKRACRWARLCRSTQG